VPWTVDLLPLAGGAALNSATPFKSARITWTLDGIGAADFDLRESDVSDGRWLYGRRRVLVKDGSGTARFQGWLDRLERGGSPGAVSYRAASRGLAAALAQAVVHGDYSEVETPAEEVAWGLIAHAQAQSGNVWGFTDGTHSGGTHPSRTRYYCDGDVIAERLNELAEMSDGFTWEIDAAGAFNTWRTARGTDRTGTHTLSPGDCMDWSCNADVSELASVVTGLGDRDDDTPCGPPLVIDTDSAAVTLWGRREVVIETENDDEFEVNEKTTAELDARLASQLDLKTTWIEGRGPWSFGSVWLGDTVTAELGAPFGGNKAVRLIGVTVTLEGLYEFVECEWEAA
jgi:hypothetical protein